MADAEAAAEREVEQEEMAQMRDTDEARTAAASPAALDGGNDDKAGELFWKEMKRNQKKRWKKFEGREE